MKLVIIANPSAGRGGGYRRIARLLESWPHRGWEVSLETTRAPGHARELARALAHAPPDRLAVCGGDGTVSEVVSGLAEASFPVAVLPAGTGNVLARELGVPLDPVAALKLALSGPVVPVDVGVLRAPGTAERRFLLMVGAGLDAFVVSRVRGRWKSVLGIAAYYLSTLRSLLLYRFSEFELALEGAAISTTSCAAANSRRYGGTLVLAPSASLHSGVLEFVAFQGRSRLACAGFLLSTALGRPRDSTWVRRLRGCRAELHGPEKVLLQADGELAGCLPCELRLLPGWLRLVWGKPPSS